jgi:NAD+ synthase (glutamine-hydrolysing)
MRLALAQLNPLVGDLEGNGRLIEQAGLEAAAAGADLLLTPELSLWGYPPRDLLQREGFLSDCERIAREMAAELHARGAGDAAVLVGMPVSAPGAPVPARNIVAVMRGGRIEAFHVKRLLPDYDVFDEPRHFTPGDRACVIDCGGAKVGIAICEDLWRAEDAIDPTQPITGSMASGVWKTRVTLPPLGYRVIRLHR